MGKTVMVRDKMQQDYEYVLTEPEGRNFAPEFTPELTPSEMLSLGVFGGRYMTDCEAEFPGWFRHAKLCPARHNPDLNYFGVLAGLPLAHWRRMGWIHPQDPRGWFQWYCRYYRGRRSADDRRQISRWKAMTRHLAQLKKHMALEGVFCRMRQRQALLQWAYDVRDLPMPDVKRNDLYPLG